MRTRPAPVRSGSVSHDWRTPLSPAKSRIYLDLVQRLETSYSMFSINLDEAVGMHRGGRLQNAFHILIIAPALCDRLARPLVAALRAMLSHSRHFGVTPHLAPLDPDNFQSPRCQRAARYNALLGRVLFTRKSQFLGKIEALAELSEELAVGFQNAAEELSQDNSSRPDFDWDFLDATHYDLNTCLRETVVILKSFLHALPEGQLSHFQDIFRQQFAASPSSAPIPARPLAHRLMALIKGQ
ncbi:MAG: hypothetical protein WCE52_20020 [Candidatus Acidiferrum sp.]